MIMKRELSKKAKLPVFKTVFAYILTYGYESWIMTEKRIRSQMQASEMRFLRRIEGVTLFDVHGRRQGGGARLHGFSCMAQI